MNDGSPVAVAKATLPGGARWRWTGKSAGDFAGGGPEVRRRQRAVVDLPWSQPRQVHGRAVTVVDRPAGGGGGPADALVSAQRGAALAVLTADCAPVVLASDEGVIAVAHAGWRGLAAGVVEAVVGQMRSLGARHIEAAIGPCIRTGCYRFGAADLEQVVAATGPEVRGQDSTGAPALNLAAGVAAALGRAGVDHIVDVGVCTACSAEHWSWRAGDRARQASVVWRP